MSDLIRVSNNIYIFVFISKTTGNNKYRNRKIN